MLVARGFRRAMVPRFERCGMCGAAATSGLAVPGADARFHDYDAAVTSCVERRALREGRQVHAHMVIARYRPPVYLATRLVIMYVRCGALDDARNVLDGMPERNVVSWTAMISGYSQSGRHADALELFVRMLRAGKSFQSFHAPMSMLALLSFVLRYSPLTKLSNLFAPRLPTTCYVTLD
jgi:pentatricopeptide repeat protein